MGNRVALISMALVAACGSKKADGPAGGSAAAGSGGSAAAAGSGGAAAAGSGSGAPAAHCIPAEADHVLSTFVADDHAATFCLKKETEEKGASTCTTVDLATGAYRPAAALPARPVEPAAVAIKQDAQGVLACKAGACTKLELPAPQVEDGTVSEYRVAVAPDGKRLAATGGALEGVVFLDGATGKALRMVKLVSEDTCVEDAYFLGEAVYVGTSNCAGPGGSAALYSWAGKKLGDVGPQDFNSYGAEPVQVAGDQWAIASYGGGGVLVFDARTAKQIHLVDIKPPADCERCDEVLGTAAHWSASPLVKLPSGKLAAIDGSGVAIIDPAAGKVERVHRMPICPAAP